MNKPTGLAAFTRKGAASAQQTATDQEPGAEQSAETRQRGRGKGDVVALTVRLPRAEWERVHQLAVSEKGVDTALFLAAQEVVEGTFAGGAKSLGLAEEHLHEVRPFLDSGFHG